MSKVQRTNDFQYDHYLEKGRTNVQLCQWISDPSLFSKRNGLTYVYAVSFDNVAAKLLGPRIEVQKIPQHPKEIRGHINAVSVRIRNFLAGLSTSHNCFSTFLLLGKSFK
jgi:hypothetical protein